MTVTYEPPLTGQWAKPGESLLMEAIMEGPAYVRSARAGRWHRVRSARRWVPEWDPDTLREVYVQWCGPHAGNGIMLTDDPPADEPRCGTCEGRAIGAGQVPTDDGWVFSPRRNLPPLLCPGSQTGLSIEDPDNFRRGTCLVCGEYVKMGARGGPYRSTWDVRRHAPGPGLIDPCLFHGWKSLTLARVRDGRPVVACVCATREERP